MVSALWGDSIGSKTPQDAVEYCKISQPAFEMQKKFCFEYRDMKPDTALLLSERKKE